MKTAYSEMLLDPRWQRRRLEILQRFNFSCECCGATDKTLHVHHKIYRRGAKPWQVVASAPFTHGRVLEIGLGGRERLTRLSEEGVA